MEYTATAVKSFDSHAPEVQRLLANLNNPWKMRLYFLSKLPSLFFWKVKVLSVQPDEAKVAIPFGWRTQNPFRSTYFAALAGTGELSAGLLAMTSIAGRPPISMLITHIEASFTKKASGLTVFTCSEGERLRDAIQRAYETGEGQTVQVSSVGVSEAGAEVCRVVLTWSFKAKQQGR